jgi:hypothetical protein
VKQRVRDAILEGVAPLGYLRWLNHRFNLGLKFTEINFSRLLDDTLRLDFPRAVQVVVQRSNCAKSPQDLQAQCEELACASHDRRHLCSGHDLVAILGNGLRQVLGSQRSAEVQVETLEIELRLGFDWNCFKQTGIYEQLRAWEARNAGWQVLALE